MGSGYFGAVWKAERPDGKPCAIKLVHGDWPHEKGSISEQDLKALTKIQTTRHPRLLALERLTLADNLLHCSDEPLRIRGFSFVVAEGLFVEVAKQMERFHADIRSGNATFEERPEIL